MTTITVTNHYAEKTYKVAETKKEVLNKFYRCEEYAGTIVTFEALDELGKECTIIINVNNFASVKVMEEE